MLIQPCEFCSDSAGSPDNVIRTVCLQRYFASNGTSHFTVLVIAVCMFLLVFGSVSLFLLAATRFLPTCFKGHNSESVCQH